MAVSEVRTQIYLERSQHDALKRTATRRSVSMAKIVREAIARYLAEIAAPPRPQASPVPKSDAAWAILDAAEEIGGSGSPGASQGAAGLEEELYGPVTA